MSEATVRLLRAVADLLGDQRLLAKRLQIDEPLLQAYVEDRLELPHDLLRKAVDIVLEKAEPSDALENAHDNRREQ